MKQFAAKILKNNQISNNFFEMELSWTIAQTPSPGQFITIRVSEDPFPLLRRPFALSNFDPLKKTCSIIFQKRGRTTEILKGMLPGEVVDVIAPLGRPFPQISTNSKVLLVAGGIGLGPILFLSNHIRESGKDTRFVFGCRDNLSLPQSQSFHKAKPIICTDDGSTGNKGTVRDYLNRNINEFNDFSVLYCCGPQQMLRSCHEFALPLGIQCWVSVEQIMACGVGACMGCVVKTVDPPGYKRACKEGPVFNSNEILWDKS